MKLLCFGLAREIIGSSEYTLSENLPVTVGALKTYLIEAYPEFKAYKQFQIAVNQSFSGDETKISSSDELAIIPPVSGG